MRFWKWRKREDNQFFISLRGKLFKKVSPEPIDRKKGRLYNNRCILIFIFLKGFLDDGAVVGNIEADASRRGF
jgi:hypothetical protein